MTMPSILPWHVWLSLAAASGLTSVAMYFWPVAFLNPTANMSLGLLMIAAVGGFVLALASRWALGHQSWARAWDWALCTIAMLLLAKLAWNVSIMKWAAVPISKLQMK